VWGQFEGYKKEKGVVANSKVETYAAVRLEVDSWRWAGVPFVIRAGKCLPTTTTEVFVKLRKPPLKNLSGVSGNSFHFGLGPNVFINLHAEIKRPGDGLVAQETKLEVVESGDGDEASAYERLLSAAMSGDELLFVREDAVEAAWAIVNPILGNGRPLYEYRPGSWGPAEADRLVADIGGWHDPEETTARPKTEAA
jgi:glucose-6-phosphate 1-dehydrogenase